jgi:hypothetical protein
MDFSSFLSALIGGLIVAITTYLFDILKAQDGKRRDERVSALLQVFKAIDSSDRKAPQNEIDDMEEAISTLQIYGSPYLVETAIKFTKELHATGSSNLASPLLKEMRNEIRREIGLPALTAEVVSFRYSAIFEKGN